jgi:(R,R)-butanediol dehydrogenase/meso-butanediol dehydrogenase/diacetyl reductase
MGGGPIGLSAVRILKIFGYGPIVLFEPVKAKRQIALLYGADHVFDPREKDVDQQVMAIIPGGFDKSFECSGVKTNVDRAIHLAADGGQVCIVSVIFTLLEMAAPYLMNFKEVRLTASISNTHQENIQCLDWMAAGILDARPLISDDEPLERLPAVYRERIDTGLAVKVLLRIGEEF